MSFNERFLENSAFESLRANGLNVGNKNFKKRIETLKALKFALEFTYKQQIRDALFKDFKKPQLEVDFTEIYPVIDEINYTCRYLRFWLKRQNVRTPLSLFGSSSYILYEPKGVCLIISPWNFPVNLTFGPLVSAIAAGNTVVLKPSEMTPNTSKVMAEIVTSIFKKDEVVLIEGDVETAKHLLKFPFNHIFFTGSPNVGKLIMEAASKNLSSVTLELGGKSPTVIDTTNNLKKVAEKIIFGKFINAGQTCIAPDYVLVDHTIEKVLVEELRKVVAEYYGSDIHKSTSYAQIVNKEHSERLNKLLEDCEEKGGNVISLAGSKSSNTTMPPTILTNLKDDMAVMEEEIFGPILPIIPYKKIEDAVEYINARPKPLALYVYSKDSSTVEYIVKNTRSGTTCINHNLLQFLNHNLPFGGANNSGIGKSHGFFGFQEFSNARSVLKQHTMSPADLLRPPYTNLKQKIVDLTIKWL